MENWAIGCKLDGERSINSSTCFGNSALAANSADKALVWLAVGTSPVNNNQNKASGIGSEPPSAFGNSDWISGMVLPLNLIPSSGSKTEPSQTKPLIPRIPP
ncbi:hypothetical protein WICPIJ_000709 [Wickerhamomyces pijperi]|uniref:Uncharacterized protein n=1 Tax=Wickerhamomyces pijperi TaxID=599730 RepID=A0A9P8QD83_WICPI|nr:hypothetical protein WICPIJ_000709 [Wickerhamomyces pijperi]